MSKFFHLKMDSCQLQTFFPGCEALTILKNVKLEDHKMVLSNLLLSKSKLGEGKAIANFICFLSKSLNHGQAFWHSRKSATCFYRARFSISEFYVSLVLLPILKLWADPIVARGYVKSEILHYSKSIVAIVSHVQKDTLIKHKMKIIELVCIHPFPILTRERSLTVAVSCSDCKGPSSPSFKYRPKICPPSKVYLWFSHSNDEGE